MKNLESRVIKPNWISLVVLIMIVLSIIEGSSGAADEPPAFFLKIAKTVPRIGRSDPYQDAVVTNLNGMSDDPWFKAANPINEMSKRKVDFSPESDTRSWQHFPLAIEGPPELWRTLAGYSHDPLYSATNEFNNRLWSRDKRTNNLHLQQ